MYLGGYYDAHPDHSKPLSWALAHERYVVFVADLARKQEEAARAKAKREEEARRYRQSWEQRERKEQEFRDVLPGVVCMFIGIVSAGFWLMKPIW